MSARSSTVEHQSGRGDGRNRGAGRIPAKSRAKLPRRPRSPGGAFCTGKHESGSIGSPRQQGVQVDAVPEFDTAAGVPQFQGAHTAHGYPLPEKRAPCSDGNRGSREGAPGTDAPGRVPANPDVGAGHQFPDFRQERLMSSRCWRPSSTEPSRKFRNGSTPCRQTLGTTDRESG